VRGLSTAALVVRFADRFDAALSDAKHRVGSPLGAWLLLACIAPASTGVSRGAIEDALGTDGADAAERASALLDEAHPAVACALALWHRKESVLKRFEEWASTLPELTETGPVPSQAMADAWARRSRSG
jgi:hypothetical protein